MGNSRYFQFMFSKHPMLTALNGLITFGSSGAVASVAGKGFQGVTRSTTGIYEVKLVENFPGYISFDWYAYSGVTGSNVTDGSFVANTPYQITALGTTAWTSVGFDSDFTPAIGAVFVASASGGSGGGTAKALTTSGISAVEVCQSQSGELQNLNVARGYGSAFYIQTLNASGSLANPTSGSEIGIRFWLRNSSTTQ